MSVLAWELRAAPAIRPIQAADLHALTRMYARLSPRTVLLRFMTSYPRGVPERMLRRLVCVDRRRSDALVAVWGGEIVADARYSEVAPGVAEIAVLVEDAWQRRGLGRMLGDRLSDLARSRGIAEFRGVMMAENAGAAALLGSLFPHAVSRVSAGEREFRIPLVATRTA